MSVRPLGAWGGVALALCGACRQPPTTEAAGANVPAARGTPESSRPDAGPAVVVSRCRPGEMAFAIDDGGAPDDLEIGDGILHADGEAVGVVHHTAAGRVAGVALVAREGSALKVVDLAPTLGDAPPPRLVSRPKDIVAAAYTAPRAGVGAGATRDLTLYSIAPDDAARPLSNLQQQRDDSLAFDLAWGENRGIVVWDEAASASRGVVRAATFSAEQRLGPSRDVSPPDSDAELPRVVSTGGGFVVVWLARSADTPTADAESSALEAIGEARTHGWLEMIAVDERGAARGSVRRLTPPSGHVTAYDMQPLGGTRGTLLFVAKDEGEEVDGSGGALLRVRVTGDSVEPPVAFTTDGLGRGAPTLVGGLEGQPLSLAWVASHEHLRLLPLDPLGAPSAAASAEPAMDEARPLLSLGAGTMLVATPLDPAAQLRTFACGG
jgi:hypothetical protein